jgi:signal transduction histidine kinase
MLDDLGLVPALEWFADRFAARTKIRVDFRHDVPHGERFAGETKTAAYRIVQESLTNVARYAGVEGASVRVWRSDGWLHVEVEDEGIGFDLEEAISREEKLGLSGMHERALLLGGDLTVITAPGEGCRVMARLPIGEHARSRAPAIST